MPSDGGAPQVFQQSDPDRPSLEALSYVTSYLLSQRPIDVIAALETRQKLSDGQGVSATPVERGRWPDSAYTEHIKSWELLTGYKPDLGDVYNVGTIFLSDSLVIPRATFIKLMTKLYELNDAVREGRMEPRIDESIPMPPPRPPPPPPKWTDEELHALEDDALCLDQIDPLTDELSDARTAKKAEDRRGYLFAMLEIAHARTRDGEDDLPVRFAHLGLTTLSSYQAAFTKLAAYLRAPERLAIVEPTIEAAKREAGISGPVTCAERVAAEGFEVTPFWADVSIDLFRLPEAPHPEGISKIEWLARCEAVFVHSRITGIAAIGGATGDMFTRILGHRVRMRYRPEISSLLRLWRVELS
jgi:hypothetical protein